ncbi:MAG: TetR/AcrR family transcriptional regulator [Akkermansiaceae bacterium]|tara:strand:- start:9022 stop:9624 length:603 start_codon:yes stop_codon:yes gene_type:complete
MPSPTATKHSKRDEIVEIASLLFYRQGYGATGIKQIIEQAGIAKGTFYTHFKSKEDLGVEWLKSRHIQWNTWLNDSLKPAEASGAKVLAAFTFLASWLKESNYRGCAFLNTMAETPDASSPMRREVVEHKRQLHQTFQSLMADHFKNEDVSEEFVIQKAGAAFLLFEGALVETQNFEDPLPITVALKEVQSMLQFKNHKS